MKDKSTVEYALMSQVCDNIKKGMPTCSIDDFWKCFGECYRCRDVGGVKRIYATGCTDCTKFAVYK
jgi:hypothetical protein